MNGSPACRCIPTTRRAAPPRDDPEWLAAKIPAALARCDRARDAIQRAGPKDLRSLALLGDFRRFVVLALVFAPARRANGYAAVHDRLTATRVLVDVERGRGDTTGEVGALDVGAPALREVTAPFGIREERFELLSERVRRDPNDRRVGLEGGEGSRVVLGEHRHAECHRFEGESSDRGRVHLVDEHVGVPRVWLHHGQLPVVSRQLSVGRSSTPPMRSARARCARARWLLPRRVWRRGAAGQAGRRAGRPAVPLPGHRTALMGILEHEYRAASNQDGFGAVSVLPFRCDPAS